MIIVEHQVELFELFVLSGQSFYRTLELFLFGFVFLLILHKLSIHLLDQFGVDYPRGLLDCIFCLNSCLLQLVLSLHQRLFSISLGCQELIHHSFMMLVHFSDLLNHLLFLCLELKFKLPLLLNELLNKLVCVLAHTIDGIIFRCQFEFKLAYRALLLFEPPVELVHL